MSLTDSRLNPPHERELFSNEPSAGTGSPPSPTSSEIQEGPNLPPPKPYAIPWLLGYPPNQNLVHFLDPCWTHPSTASSSPSCHSVPVGTAGVAAGGNGEQSGANTPLSKAINQLLTLFPTRTVVSWSKAYLPSLLGFSRRT